MKAFLVYADHVGFRNVTYLLLNHFHSSAWRISVNSWLK
jgi:hypothetical protein